MIETNLHAPIIAPTSSPLEQLWMINNSQSLEVLELYDQSIRPYFLFKHCVTVPITLISILCIIITIVVVTRKGIWRPTVTYIIVLASVDLCTVVLQCLLSLDYFFLPLFESDIYTNVETIVSEIADTLLFISNWLTTILATERFIAICYPLKSRRISKRHRKLAVLLVIMLSVLVKLPGFFFQNIFGSINKFLTVYFLHKLYVWIVQLFLFLIIPFAILTFVNIRLILAIRKSSKLLRAAPSNRSVGSQRMYSASETAMGQSHLVNSTRLNRSVWYRNSLSHANDGWLNPDSSNSAVEQNASSGDKYQSEYDVLPKSCEPKNLYAKRALREERKITITLICLVITFFLFQGPFVLTSVITRFSTVSMENPLLEQNNDFPGTVTCDSGRGAPVCPPKAISFENYMNPLSIIALALKSDLYFLFYCWFCERFLKSLRTLFKPTKCCQCIFRLRQSLTYSKKTNTQRKQIKFQPFGVNVVDGYRLPHHQYNCPSHAFRRPTGQSGVLKNDGTKMGTLYDYRPPPMPFVLHSNRRTPANILKSLSLPWEWHEKRESGVKLSKSGSHPIDNRTGFHMPPNFYCSRGRIVVTSRGAVKKSPSRFGSPGKWSVKTRTQKHGRSSWSVNSAKHWFGITKTETINVDQVPFRFSHRTLSKFYNDSSIPSTSATSSQEPQYDNQQCANNEFTELGATGREHVSQSPCRFSNVQQFQSQRVQPKPTSAPVSTCHEVVIETEPSENAEQLVDKHKCVNDMKEKTSFFNAWSM